MIEDLEGEYFQMHHTYEYEMHAETIVSLLDEEFERFTIGTEEEIEMNRSELLRSVLSLCHRLDTCRYRWGRLTRHEYKIIFGWVMFFVDVGACGWSSSEVVCAGGFCGGVAWCVACPWFG